MSHIQFSGSAQPARKSIHTDKVVLFTTFRHYVPFQRFLFDRSSIAKLKICHGVNVVCDGSPSRMRRVLLISLGMTIRPRSSTRRTMPVAFIYIYLLILQITMLVSVKQGDLFVQNTQSSKFDFIRPIQSKHTKKPHEIIQCDEKYFSYCNPTTIVLQWQILGGGNYV